MVLSGGDDAVSPGDTPILSAGIVMYDEAAKGLYSPFSATDPFCQEETWHLPQTPLPLQRVLIYKPASSAASIRLVFPFTSTSSPSGKKVTLCLDIMIPFDSHSAYL